MPRSEDSMCECLLKLQYLTISSGEHNWYGTCIHAVCTYNYIGANVKRTMCSFLLCILCNTSYLENLKPKACVHTRCGVLRVVMTHIICVGGGGGGCNMRVAVPIH